METAAVREEISLSPESIEALSSAILDKLMTETYLGMILEDMARQIKAKRHQETSDDARLERIKKIDTKKELSCGLAVEDFLQGFTEHYPGRTHPGPKTEIYPYKS